jgi:hypothetical protein
MLEHTLEAGFIQLARYKFSVRLECRDNVEFPALIISGTDCASVNHQRRTVQAAHGHHAAGHIFIAAGNRDVGIVPMGCHDRLYRVCDQIT